MAALGGQKFLTMEDRVESGRAYSFYRDQDLSGLSIATIYTRYFNVAAGQDRARIWACGSARLSARTRSTATSCSARIAAWEVHLSRRSRDGDRIASTATSDTTLNDILYLLRMRLNEPGLIFESRGSDVVENQPVEIVDITDSENRVMTVYFHKTTKLPVKETWVWRDPKTHERNDEVTRFARYRDVGGGCNGRSRSPANATARRSTRFFPIRC